MLALWLAAPLEAADAPSQPVEPAAPVEPTTERITESIAIGQQIGKIRWYGSGHLWGNVMRGRGGAQLRELSGTPWFLSAEARGEQEQRLAYDLRRWGGTGGVGRALNETTDLLATYRLDSYKVFNTSPTVDPAFRTVAGRTAVTALGLGLQHDSRDDPWYPTTGYKAKVGGEVAVEGLGGDYDFVRLDSDVAGYVTPFRDRDSWLADVTFVERLKVGWVEEFDDNSQVPFFERYFAGGTKTVRGHRSRWLTPRGLEDQFVGGEILLVNNVEARMPIFADQFDRRLSAAVFFDAGRAFRKFSDIGDFGYGVGGGLRYVVHLWKLAGVARADYGVSLDNEGDDSTSRLHLSFGVPF